MSRSKRRIPGKIVLLSPFKDRIFITGRFYASGSVTFFDADECIEYILSINDEPIFFVLQNIRNNQLLVAVAQDLPQVHSIYIHGEYFGIACAKIICVTRDDSDVSTFS